MIQWIALILLVVVITLGVKNKPIEIEQRLHAKLVYMLAGEDLSEVRVEMDGRKVLLIGPRLLVPQAVELIQAYSGVSQVRSEFVNEPALDFEVLKDVQTQPAQVFHSDGIFWPVKEPPTALVNELLITKMHRSIEVNGAVSNAQMRESIHERLTKFIEIPEYLYDVRVDHSPETPNWFIEDMPLMLPFVQWVEEGQIWYLGDQIHLEGVVLDEQASQAIESAITNTPAHYEINNRLEIWAN